ncbi:MAG: glycosyltransferase family 2 protein [Prevotella sp.]|nr:glycosyltransferase family 2 protein [Prevotella sp.]
MKDGVSVIVCCYNSAWIIERCLGALIKQVLPDDFGWEVIVVDNKCTDNTVDVVRKFKEVYELPLVLVEEPLPGLLNARIKGINSANYAISIYCDDDNLLCPDYVYGMYKIMHSDGSIGCAGGMGIPEYMIEPHSDILRFSQAYALGSQRIGSLLFGAGLCVRTDIVRKIYKIQKFYLTGRCGEMLLAGDDGELVASILIRGYRKQATDNLTYVHVLPPKRLTWEYLEGLFKGFALVHPLPCAMECAINGHPPYYMLLLYFKRIWIVLTKIPFFRNRRQKLIIDYNINIIRACHFWGFKKILSIYNEYIKYKNEEF